MFSVCHRGFHGMAGGCVDATALCRPLSCNGAPWSAPALLGVVRYFTSAIVDGCSGSPARIVGLPPGMTAWTTTPTAIAATIEIAATIAIHTFLLQPPHEHASEHTPCFLSSSDGSLLTDTVLSNPDEIVDLNEANAGALLALAPLRVGRVVRFVDTRGVGACASALRSTSALRMMAAFDFGCPLSMFLSVNVRYMLSVTWSILIACVVFMKPIHTPNTNHQPPTPKHVTTCAPA